MIGLKLILVGALVPFLVQFAWADQPAPQPGQHPETFEGQITVRLNYLLFLPQNYGKDPQKKWPLIFFLHGAGERGDDLNLLKKHGLPKIVESRPDFPFIVVSPQCPANSWWRPYELNALLEQILADYPIDPDRVYLTGLSMGGFGTWEWAEQFPNRFAAIAPMCGGGNTLLAGKLRHIPVWVFHGDADPTVPVARSDEMVEALRKVGADVKYTRYPGVGHDCWTQSYANPELYDWFLSHHRGEPQTTATTEPAR